jgi:hypothetical protein
MRRVSVTLVILGLASSAHGYDSRCRLAEPDCEGIEAARTPWVRVEHAELWLQSREEAGLPAALDQPFVVRTPTGGLDVGAFLSLQATPLDFSTTFVERQLEIAVFAQLPDLSYTLWDWTSGNEGCPPAGDAFGDCHLFKAHMGWLNSTHFLPQAGQYFSYLHGLAVARARECGTMASRLDLAGVDGTALLQACDREALLIEAQAHHYLQDAWSMGHMWQRWGSPELGDFRAAVARGVGLSSVKAVGDAVGRASGIIHGAKALVAFDDAMCAPDNGIEFVYDGVRLAGAGDLFLEEVREDERLANQRVLLGACTTTAVREVYLASARSFGPATDSQYAALDLALCFPQRATNRAIALGAAIQIPLLAAANDVVRATLLNVGNAYLASVGLPPTLLTIYVPLTSEHLTRVNPVVEQLDGEPLIAEAILDRWHDDMTAIQGAIRRNASVSPDTTQLADNGLGSLLGMAPNATYPGRPSYADPPLPWTPTLTTVPLEPTIDNAANILARTFVDAHAADWCGVMTAEGDSEFSLRRLRERCVDVNAGPASCELCETFATRHLTSTTLPQPLCSILTPGSAIVDVGEDPALTAAELAATWCRTPLDVASIDQLFVEVAFGCRGSSDAYTIVATVVDNDGAPLAGIDVTFSIDDVEIGVVRSDNAGEVRLVPPPYDGTAVLVAQTGTSRQQVKVPLSAEPQCSPCEGDIVSCTSAIQQQFTVECPAEPACDDAQAEAACGCFSAGCSGAGSGFARDGVAFESFCCGCN